MKTSEHLFEWFLAQGFVWHKQYELIVKWQF